MSQIFICYSRSDTEFMKRLNISLTKHSIDTWVDFQNIPSGTDWVDEIHEGLKQCDIMILIISPNSMMSPQVGKEWKYFINHTKTLIPILWKATSNINYQLDPIQHIDFHTQEYDKAFGALLSELQKSYVHPYPTSDSIKISTSKSGNIFWICHDLMELTRWLLEGIPKEWIDVGFRQSLHHAVEIGLDEGVISKLEQLKTITSSFSEDDWKDGSRRQQYAREVTILFNVIAQEIQASDPNFNSGPG